MKQILTAKLDKKTGAGNGFHNKDKQKLKDIGGGTASAITSRYYKGISADCDNVVIELYVSETHPKEIRTVSRTKYTPQKES